MCRAVATALCRRAAESNTAGAPRQSEATTTFIRWALTISNSQVAVVLRDHIARFLGDHINVRDYEDPRDARKNAGIHHAKISHPTHAKAAIEDGHRIPVRADWT